MENNNKIINMYTFFVARGFYQIYILVYLT